MKHLKTLLTALSLALASVQGSNAFSQLIAAGGYHSLFKCSEGMASACGLNKYGELGDGTTTNRLTPVQVSALSGITAVAAGNYHSLFLKNDGTVWACGENFYGQLGDGTQTTRLTPVQVSGLCSVTGITENNNKTNMVVFPNPFSSQTTLRSAEFFANATLTVENCFGQIVMQRKNISGEEITITRGNRQSGFYLFSLTENNKILYSGKLLISDN